MNMAGTHDAFVKEVGYRPWGGADFQADGDFGVGSDFLKDFWKRNVDWTQLSAHPWAR